VNTLLRRGPFKRTWAIGDQHREWGVGEEMDLEDEWGVEGPRRSALLLKGGLYAGPPGTELPSDGRR